LAFFTAGNTVLPVATRYAAGPLGADATGVGIAIGAFSVAALLLRPVVGWASDRAGRRPLMLFGGGLTVVALLLHLVATTLPLFIVARSVFGVAEAFFFVSAVAAVTDLAPPERRGEAINIASLAVYLGLAFGPFLGEAILGAADYTAVWIAAGLMAASATVITLFVPETAPAALRPRVTGEPRPRTRIVHPAGVAPGLLILSGMWGMAGFLAFVPLYATELGMDGAGPALAVYALIVVGLRIAFVTAPDRFGAAPLGTVALLGSAAGMAVIGFVHSPAGLLIGTAVFATGIAFLFPAMLSLAVSRVDETERGSVVGTTTAFVDVSFGIAPAVLGVVAGAVGFSGAFLLSGVIALVGAAWLVLDRDRVARPVAA
jgi:MFS family permease